MKLGNVVRQLTDENNLPTGKAHDNAILENHNYIVKFDDREQPEYGANEIS
jgi:hypothetical protein